jgi:hypothetical protein
MNEDNINAEMTPAELIRAVRALATAVADLLARQQELDAREVKLRQVVENLSTIILRSGSPHGAGSN